MNTPRQHAENMMRPKYSDFTISEYVDTLTDQQVDDAINPVSDYYDPYEPELTKRQMLINEIDNYITAWNDEAYLDSYGHYD